MKKLVVLNKKEGQTPLEALKVFRAKHKKYKDVKMTYAGRLDPLASGLLVILLGDEVKSKEEYTKLDKEYEFKVLFGFATDTYDILGKITNAAKVKIDKERLEKQIKKSLNYFVRKFYQPYPMYSSKTVDGKPLFVYARNNQKVKIPRKKVEIIKLSFLNIKNISSKKLLSDIEKRIKKVKGDFRQDEISRIWRKHLESKDSGYLLASFQVKCSSGMYVRSLSNSLGKKLGSPALAYSIKRTKVGKFGKML
jgi:tRNA pseudouridine55 synthase